MTLMTRRLADHLVERIRALITERGLEAGMRLPSERQLAQELGVSRNSLREALQILIRDG
ncbi:GntR family transcriptional regulator, partial [Cronobacter sakazakii]|nr:GntR family transcriptional regulator [Cronobacter sakazakii]